MLHKILNNGEARQNKFSSALKVILWPDTFNNYFHPEIALAAVDVFEACRL